MAEIGEMFCCGVREMAQIGGDTPEQSVMSLAEHRFEAYDHDGYAFAIFTAACKETYGEKLAAYIKKNRLGAVKKSTWKDNPNTDNPVRVYIWELAQTNLKRWFKKHGGETNTGDY